MMSVDCDTLNDFLSDFGYVIHDDDDLINKVNSTCTLYNISAEDLCDEIIACAKNLKRKDIDMTLLDVVDTELAKKLKINLDNVTKSSSKPKRQVLAERTVLPTFNLDDIDMNDDTDNNSSLNSKYKKFAPYKDTPGNNKYQSRTDKGNSISSIKGEIFISSSSDCQKVKIDVISPQSSMKYGIDKAANVIEAKCQRFSLMADLFQEANPQITHWTYANIISDDNVFVYGEVMKDTNENLPMDDSSICLMLDDENGSTVKLDVSQIEEISLFPGQIVAFRGTNEDGLVFRAVEQYHAKPLQMAPISKHGHPDSVHIWSAAGPFTSSDNCSYEQLCDLLESVRIEKPHVLILQGPFVDRRNKFMDDSSFDISYKQVMDTIMCRIAQYLDGCSTDIILQPSSLHDASILPVFPSPPILLSNNAKKLFAKRVHVVSDPCILRIAGIEVAVTNSEILTHLSKNEWHKSSTKENTDRISRLISHLFDQRSLYPLSPPSIPSSLEESIRICQLSSCPHMLIMPSILPPSVKLVNGCVVVNPGPLVRFASASLLKSDISLSLLTDPSHFSDSGHWHIVKI